jgi:hypothetical protein
MAVRSQYGVATPRPVQELSHIPEGANESNESGKSNPDIRNPGVAGITLCPQVVLAVVFLILTASGYVLARQLVSV